MPRRIYKKPHRAKKKKALLAKASFWKLFFGLGIVGGAVWCVCFSPALEVKEIKISGAEKVSDKDCAKMIEDEVNKKIALFDSKSILLFDMERTKKEILAKFPQVQDIKIERQFPSKISASVEERRGVAMVSGQSGAKYAVDIDGIAFEEVSSETGMIEISNPRQEISLGKLALSKDILNGILRIKGEAESSGGIRVAAAEIATPERVNILTEGGWYVYFNPLKDIDGQLAKFIAVMADDSFKAKAGNLEYVDVRFTRVYLKEKNEISVESGIEDIKADGN